MGCREHQVCRSFLDIQVMFNNSKIGRHPCLWCLRRSDDLKKFTSPGDERTTEGILRDHQQFLRAGGNLKEAKNYNNAVNEPFFKLPLSQVSTKETTNKN